MVKSYVLGRDESNSVYGYWAAWVQFGDKVGPITGEDYSRPGYYGSATVPVDVVLGELAN